MSDEKERKKHEAEMKLEREREEFKRIQAEALKEDKEKKGTAENKGSFLVKEFPT